MKVEEMVEELDKFCLGTLSIVHYYEWELHSYDEESLFFGPKGLVQDNSFKLLIEKAYKIMKEDKIKNERKT